MRALIFLVLFCGLQAEAANVVLNQIASKYFADGQHRFLSHTSLGVACGAFRNFTWEPECNPAFLGDNDDDSENVFGANIYFGNDYPVVYKNRDLISGNNKSDLLKSLLLEKDPIQFDAASQLWYRGSSWVIAYQPIAVSYFSDVNNQAYPQIAVHALQEQSVMLQYGGFVDQSLQLRMGLQIRYVDRSLVHEEFYFFDAVPNLDNYLISKKQHAFWIEPSVAFSLYQDEEERSKHWNPTFSVQFMQTGFVDKNYEGVPTRPISDLGFSISPDLEDGHLQLGLGYRALSEIKSDQKLRLALNYGLGLVDFFTSADNDDFAFGLKTTYQSFSLGLSLTRNLISNFDNQQQTKDSAHVEIHILL